MRWTQKLGFLLALLLAPTLALATPADQYATQGCANDGDGTAATCAGSPGGAGAFNTLSSWESQNLTLTQNLTLHCSGTFTEALTIDGWTTTSGRLILDACTIAGSNYGAQVTVADDNVDFTDCSISKSSGGSLSLPLITLTGANDGSFQRCRLFHGSMGNDGGTTTINLGTNTGYIFRNNFIYDQIGAGASMVNWSFSGSNTFTFDNNTMNNNAGTALLIAVDGAGSGTATVRNNVCTAHGTACFDLSVSGSHTLTTATNCSSDSTSPQSGCRTVAVTYVDAPTKDFHLDAGETDLIDLGTDLTGTFTDDIDGDTRTATFDIGADEIPEGTTTTTTTTSTTSTTVTTTSTTSTTTSTAGPTTTTTTVTTTSTTTTTTVTTTTTTTTAGPAYTDIPGDTKDQDNSGGDAAGPTNDTDNDGYTEDGTLEGYDCDDTNRRMFPGVWTTTGCSAGEAKQCQSDGTFGSCVTDYGATGTTYWIDPSGGSDSNNGTSRATAFQTPGCVSYYTSGAPACNVHSSIACGDTIILLAGTYSQKHSITTYGNYSLILNGKSCSGNPIRIIAEGAVTFTPTGTSVGSGSGAILLKDSTGVLLDGGLSGTIASFYVGPNDNESGGIRLNDTSEVEVRNWYVHDLTGAGDENPALMYASGGSAWNFHHNILYDMLDDGTGGNGANECLFVGFNPGGTSNRFHHNAIGYTNSATPKCGAKIKHALDDGTIRFDHNLVSRAWIVKADSGAIDHNMMADMDSFNYACGTGADVPYSVMVCDNGGPAYPGGTVQYNTIVNARFWLWVPNNDYNASEGSCSNCGTYKTFAVSKNLVTDDSSSYGAADSFAVVEAYGSNTDYTGVITGGKLTEVDGCYYTTTSGGLKWSLYGGSPTPTSDNLLLVDYQSAGYCTSCTSGNPTLDSTLAPTTVCTTGFGFYAGEATTTTTTTTTSTTTTSTTLTTTSTTTTSTTTTSLTTTTTTVTTTSTTIPFVGSSEGSRRVSIFDRLFGRR